MLRHKRYTMTMKSFRVHKPGYTLIELTVVIALIGLMTLTLIGSFSNNTDTESFSGNVRLVVDRLEQSQVSAYSMNTQTSCPLPDRAECYERGILHEYDAGANTLTISDLYGEDVLRMREDGDEFGGIHGRAVREVIDFRDRNLRLSLIDYNGSLTTRISVAFLSPAGSSYTRDDVYRFDGSDYSPYDEQRPLTFTFTSPVTTLEAEVAYDAQNDTINTSIR